METGKLAAAIAIAALLLFSFGCMARGGAAPAPSDGKGAYNGTGNISAVQSSGDLPPLPPDGAPLGNAANQDPQGATPQQNEPAGQDAPPLPPA